MVEPRYMSVQDTAKYLAVSRWTLYRLVKDQLIDHYAVRGRLVFDKKEIDAWMRRQKIPARPVDQMQCLTSRRNMATLTE
jgi:excisionase family DNA binding protein